MKLQVHFTYASRSLKKSIESGVAEHSPRTAMAVSGVGCLQGGRKCENGREGVQIFKGKPILIAGLFSTPPTGSAQSWHAHSQTISSKLVQLCL
jgi:hypothetical protein